jgi:L-fuconate dehydratase
MATDRQEAVRSVAGDRNGRAGLISAVEVLDVRFPTSSELDGSDAMNPSPDYSAAYIRLRTADGETGYSLVFTVGRGNDLEVAAVEAMRPLVVGRHLGDLVTDVAGLGLAMTADSQMRWLGPNKGVIHMAAGGIVNAAWDLLARRAGQPLWQLLSGLEPEQIVSLVDFRYLADALTPSEALSILEAARAGRQERTAKLLSDGYPAYTTTPGWLGYSDERLAALSAGAKSDGFPMVKLKVGADRTDDLRRLGIAREVLGDEFPLSVDANQIWGVPDAISALGELARFDPYWVEEPTSPDDIAGHAAIRRAVTPIKVATGEHVHNAVMFKQYLQMDALDVVQLDASRVAGVNENLAIILLAARFGVPVCPHAGGVGLCEMVQHLAMFDFVAVGASEQGRFVEHVDHLHQHFATPARVEAGRYVAPTAPGAGAEILPASIDQYAYPTGRYWSEHPR